MKRRGYVCGDLCFPGSSLFLRCLFIIVIIIICFCLLQVSSISHMLTLKFGGLNNLGLGRSYSFGLLGGSSVGLLCLLFGSSLLLGLLVLVPSTLRLSGTFRNIFVGDAAFLPCLADLGLVLWCQVIKPIKFRGFSERFLRVFKYFLSDASPVSPCAEELSDRWECTMIW